MKKNFLLWIVASLILVGLNSCEKNDTEITEEEEMITSEDLSTVQNLYQDTEDELEYQLEFRDDDNNCPTITITPEDGSFPRTVLIDYGTEGCEGPNGRTRRGQINIEQSAGMLEEGAVRTAYFVDFYVDDVQLEGTKTWTNLGYDTDGNIAFNRNIDGATITFPDDSQVSWEADHMLSQIAGGSTLTILDNEFEITGSSSGVNRNGVAFSSEITSPLIKYKLCPWLVAGTWEVSVGQFTRTLDYGNGDCDRKATVTLPNGQTRTILIRAWWR